MNSRNITVVKKSFIKIVEMGKVIPNGGIVILYDKSKLSELFKAIDMFMQNSNKFDNSILVGKQKDVYEILQFEKILYFMADGNFIYCKTDKKS